MLVDFDYIVNFQEISLYFKLTRSVLKIGSFEFINVQYFNSTFKNLKIARLDFNATGKIVVFTQCSRQ